MSTWSCPACTYINPVSRTTCEMCPTQASAKRASVDRRPGNVGLQSFASAPARAAVAAVVSSWNCSICTYTNPPSKQKCEMCDTSRPVVGAGRAVPKPSSPSPSADVSQVVFSSWLKKKSPKAVLGRHIWEARYFVLYSDRLLYFRRYDESFDLNKFAGCIMLTDIDSVIAQTSSSNSTRYRFNIQLANSDKVFQLMSDGEEVDKGKKWNVLLLDMLPERGGAKVGVGKFWKAGAETPPSLDMPRRRASSIRRQNVYAGRNSFSGLSAATEQKKEPMTTEDKDLILLVIADTRVALKNLDLPTKEKILGVMVKKQYQTGQVCVRAGESSSLFFVVKAGSFSAQKVNKKMTFSVGTCFGEEDLLSEQNSSVTITAMEDSVCWCLDRYAYKEVLVQSNLGRSAQYLAFLTANRLLSALSETALRQLAGALEEAEYGAGEEIVTQGDVGESFYIVKSGECEVVKDGVKMAHYWEGDSFGERALLQGVTRAATVVAVTEVVVLALDRITFTNLLGPLEAIKTKQAKEEKPPELAGYSVGDRLEVQTPKGPQKGTVKYVGYPHFTKRARLGLELDLAMGKHDGHSKGQRYFKCASKHGIFVAADEVISVVSKVKPQVPKPSAVAAPKANIVRPPVSNGAPVVDLFDLMSSPMPAPVSSPAPAPNGFSSMFLSQPEGPRLVSPFPSSDPFDSLSRKPLPPATAAVSPLSNDPFGALAVGQKPVQPMQPPSKTSILDDIFNSQALVQPQQPSGLDLSLMTGPMKWTPPAGPSQVNSPSFQPSNYANSFLASLPEDLDDRELKTGPRVQQGKPHNQAQFSDDESDTEDGKAGNLKAIGPGGAKGVDDLLFGQLGLSASSSPVPTKPPPMPINSYVGNAPSSMPTKPPPAPTPLMTSLGVMPRKVEAKDPFSVLDTELAFQHAPRQTRFSTDEEPLHRPQGNQIDSAASFLDSNSGITQARSQLGVAVSVVPQPPRDHKPGKVDEFREIGELGRGTFGTVKLVTDSVSQFTYALKTIDKEYLIKQNQVEFVKNERLCLSMMDNPFLIKMYAASMDAKNIYFILEPAMGGELFNLLNEKEKFNQDHARFYAASIVMAFEYMHSIGIVYRDLKPENILLDDVGYVKLTDFGFAKQLGTGRTNTFCGTPDYLSPEIVSNKGHGFGTDWWCLGVLIYEMLTGTTPFFHEGGPLMMYEKIVSASVSYPDYVSEEARDLIGGLLSKIEAKRIGVLAGGASLIKQHPFFDGFDWDGLVLRTIPAPFPKPLRDKFDLSHFVEFTRADDTEGEP